MREKIMSQHSASLREIIRTVDLAAAGLTESGAIEAATVYAVQLGYAMSHGTGGAYADAVVSPDHAAIIADLLANTNADGVYTGPLMGVADLAADHGAPAREADRS